MLPAVYDLLLEHKAEFDFGPHDPVFANRNGQRNAVDNVRRTIVETAVERANELLVARAQREIVHCTPHTLRRTFASILAEVNLPPRRAMYLLGHTDPTLTMRVYQQVIDMGEGGLQTLEQAIGCTIAEAFTLLSGRGFWHPIGTRARKRPPSSVYSASWKAQKRLRHGDFSEAAEGTRTLDLLHGKQTL